MNDKNQSYYETQSLPLVAACICLGISLDSIRKAPDGKTVFILFHTEQLDRVIENFWKKTLVVEPNSFWESIRFLKSRIYGG